MLDRFICYILRWRLILQLLHTYRTICVDTYGCREIYVSRGDTTEYTIHESYEDISVFKVVYSPGKPLDRELIITPFKSRLLTRYIRMHIKRFRRRQDIQNLKERIKQVTTGEE